MGGAVKAIKKTGSELVQTAKNVVANPLPVLETVALSAAGVPAPVAAGIVNYANGGNATTAVTSALSSYAGQQAGEAYAPAAQGADNIDVGGGYNPATGAGDTTTATAAAAPTVGKAAVSGATKGATQALASGQPLSQALKTGLTSGIESGAGTYVGEGVTDLTGSQYAGQAANILTGQTLANIFNPSSPGSPKNTAYTPQYVAQQSTTGETTGLTGGSTGGEIQSGETGGKRRNVWDESSLRLKDALGT